MTRTVEVPCPVCGTVVPVQLTDGEPEPGPNGTVAVPVVADKFEAWQHGLTCTPAEESHSLRPPAGFVPRHETMSAEDFTGPADNPNDDNDYSPGS